MMDTRARTGMALVCAAALALSLSSGSVIAQGKELSDKSVQMLVEYAWTLTPAKFTSPNGTTIEVDKSKPEAVKLPLEVAREVVKVGRMSAHAQWCDLAEEQEANFRTLMRRQEATAKWSSQQTLFIQRLHQTTVMILTGKIVIREEKEGDRTIVERDAKTNITAACTEEQRQRTKAQILSYINSAPPPAAKAPAPKTAEPAKASTQKK